MKVVKSVLCVIGAITICMAAIIAYFIATSTYDEEVDDEQ